MAKSNEVDGAVVLQQALNDLKNMQSGDWKSTLKTSVRVPMTAVMRRAKGNLASISPGKTPLHRTYLGRLVSAGFALRSLAMQVTLYASKGVVRAVLGVKAEAFYVLSFFELGTSKIQRQPWLTPALEQSKDTVVREVGNAILKRIKSIANKSAAKTRGAQ